MVLETRSRNDSGKKVWQGTCAWPGHIHLQVFWRPAAGCTLEEKLGEVLALGQRQLAGQTTRQCATGAEVTDCLSTCSMFTAEAVVFKIEEE